MNGGKAQSDEETGGKRARPEAQKKTREGKEERLIKKDHDDRGEKRDKADMGKKKDRQTRRESVRERREREID